MKTLHFDCFSGISGDMTLGALVDLGVDPRELLAELKKLPLTGWHLDFERAERCGIYGTQAIVNIGDRGQGTGGSKHNHKHGEGHEHEHHHEHAGHTSWKEIRELIQNSAVRPGAKKIALRIFELIAKAEGEVHGVSTDEVCFHEVGAVDSIIDIVGAAVCLDILAPEHITCSSVELGGGFVHCAHGILPVPAPAVLKLCAGMPVTTGGFPAEMTTPTGAGILAACVDEFIQTAAFTPVKTAYGIGNRIFDKPNALRVSWRESGSAGNSAPDCWDEESLAVLETNLDDMTGEELGFLMENLFDAGALDVTFTPCIMKKNRPATCVSALSTQQNLHALKKCIFEKSTALGIKIFNIQRSALRRRTERAAPLAGIAASKKIASFPGGERSKIEYEDAARLAREKQISLREARAVLDGGFLARLDGNPQCAGHPEVNV
ncbi:MAG: nickel pincer cofactor biosynthesis protein LarC [Spirochaetaceae bacterium]|jgi:uncharacterized protein (TIGR00299 family) protein|nr:nickel pincer cofactor biosynthesis protein LarC [Spirochaetaceae bacterium]